MDNKVFTAACYGRLEELKGLLDHLPQWEVSRLLLTKQEDGSFFDTFQVSTPLMVSCWKGHQEVVEYLVDKCPASIEETGSVKIRRLKKIEGVTPLWFAAFRGHLDIVKTLVNSGANVKTKTKTNSTPLHAACFHGHCEIVKYLVKNMADMDVKNGDGENYGMIPLLMASVKGHQHIVEYLISQRELVSKQERIDALELLGATFVNIFDDFVGASQLWKRAIEERCEVPVIPKTTKKSPIAAYNNMLEFETVREVEQMVFEPDSMQMQALLVRERILGQEHCETFLKIHHRGSVYAHHGNYKRCISLWMYAFNIQQKRLKHLDTLTHTLLCLFTRLFCVRMTDEQLLENFSDIMMVFRQAVKELQAGQDEAMKPQTIEIILCLVSHLARLIPGLEKEKVYEIKQAVHFFVKVGAKGRGGASPLHIACSWDREVIDFRSLIFHSLATINLLLECGAPVDAKDNVGNTALHRVASNKPVKAGVIQSLIQNGAHFDLVNNKKETFYDLLQGIPLHEITNSEFPFSLECLAARVARKHDLKLDSLPLNLRDFVLNH